MNLRESADNELNRKILHYVLSSCKNVKFKRYQIRVDPSPLCHPPASPELSEVSVLLVVAA